MRGTLRMPNAMVAASKLRSANGSASALASVKVTICSPPRSIARSRPTASMSGLISQTMTRVCVPPASIIRNAMSPVPPAMSIAENGSRFGGLTAVTSAFFQARCSPNDIRSFIRS